MQHNKMYDRGNYTNLKLYKKGIKLQSQISMIVITNFCDLSWSKHYCASVALLKDLGSFWST